MSVSAIYRHPIKGIGREALAHSQLIAGQTLPGDRIWAVAHEASQLPQDGTWARCLNFARAASAPQLMAVTAKLDGNVVNLSHPSHGQFRFDPETDAAALTEWVAALIPDGRAKPKSVYRADTGLTDSEFPSVSIMSDSSLDAFGNAMGTTLSPHRFRGNIWIGGFDPWQEFDWVGHEIEIGSVRLRIEEPIERCRATMANPDTGAVDQDTLNTLNGVFGHQNFGVNARVVESGEIRLGDRVRVV